VTEKIACVDWVHDELFKSSITWRSLFSVVIYFAILRKMFKKKIRKKYFANIVGHYEGRTRDLGVIIKVLAPRSNQLS
jgi:hypothetical protein